MIAGRFGKMPTTLVRRRISLFSRSWRVVRPDLPPVRHWESGGGQYLWRRLRQQLGRLREALGQLLHHACVLRPHLLGRGLLVDGAHHRRHEALRAFRHAGEQVRHEVRATALPGGLAEDRGDRVLQPLVGVRGDQLHTREPPRHQPTQEAEPEGAVLARPHVDAQHLALAPIRCPRKPWTGRQHSARPTVDASPLGSDRLGSDAPIDVKQAVGEAGSGSGRGRRSA